MKTKIDISDHFDSVLICAVRYCLGRQSYMPGLIQDWIMAHPEAVNSHAKAIILQDITEADRIRHYEHFDIDGLGDTRIDRPGWLRFKEWLERLEVRE